MDLGRAQIAYDNQEPDYKDTRERFEVLFEGYKRMIQAAVVTRHKYAFVTADGRDMAYCPVQQIAEEMWSEHEICREAITAVMEGKDVAEIGEKFNVLVSAIVKKMVIECAEDQLTSEEE